MNQKSSNSKGEVEPEVGAGALLRGKSSNSKGELSTTTYSLGVNASE